MCIAITRENLLFVEYALQHGFDVNQLIYHIFTQLPREIDSSNLEILRYLIENGADVIQCDQNRNMDEGTVIKMISSNIVNEVMMGIMNNKGN